MMLLCKKMVVFLGSIRVIFLYVPLVVFAIMFVVLLFYKLDKEYGHIVEELENRK